MNWDKIIKWKLLAGSHDFPGPDGGTCINEAAIIAAGFKYKKVRTAADCPPCFSPVLSAYLIGINDMLPNAERQRLMPFVMRLSGSADSSSVEQQRLELIVLRTMQKVVSSAMLTAGLSEQGKLCSEVTTFEEATKVARAAGAAGAARAAAGAAYAAGAADAAGARAARAAYAAAEAARAARAVGAAGAGAATQKKLYDDCITIVEEAFAIGNQATPIDVACVTERLERAKVPA